METQLPSAATVGSETDRICSRNIVIYIESNKLIKIDLKSSFFFCETTMHLHL